MRVRLFSKEHPEGFLFTDAVELRKAEESGQWVDAEWKVGQEQEKSIIKEDIIAKTVPKEDDIKYCACGCGTPTKGTWALGHYSKHQKAMRKANGDSQNSKPPD